MDSSTAEHVALVDQLVGLAEARLLDPMEILVGDDEALTVLRERVRIDAQVWAAQLLGADERTARHMGAKLIGALYPGDAPFEMPRTWWRSPLGRTIARQLGHPFADAVSYAVAGAMLGITRQGVHDLAARGKLAPHPDGGIDTASIRARLEHHGFRH